MSALLADLSILDFIILQAAALRRRTGLIEAITPGQLLDRKAELTFLHALLEDTFLERRVKGHIEKCLRTIDVLLMLKRPVIFGSYLDGDGARVVKNANGVNVLRAD